MDMDDYFVPWPETQKISGNKSRVTVWRWEKLGIFPKRIKTGPNSVSWSAKQLAEWHRKKIEGE